MEEIITIEKLTTKGGHLLFKKEIMFEWMKEKSVEFEEVDSVTQYSLKFLEVSEKHLNSFIEIYADMEHFDDCTDVEIFTLIPKEEA